MSERKRTPIGLRHDYRVALGKSVCQNCGKTIDGTGAMMAAFSDHEVCPKAPRKE